MEDRILCLVGESGSGKTTLTEALEKEGVNYIQSYTTRKPRYEGERGHIFVNLKEFEDMSTVYFIENVIAHTYFDYQHYWAVREQYRGKGTSVYVIDTAGIKEIKEKVKDAEIIVIYLKADEDTRRKRMIKRYREAHIKEDTQLPERQMINGDAYHSANKRIAHDKEAFNIVECNYTINANDELAEVVEAVKSILEGRERH